MVEIVLTGHYTAASGAAVDVRHLIDEAVQGTVSYPPEVQVSPPPPRSPPAGLRAVEVRNATTLAAVQYLRGKGFDPAALNFAAATSPGGGFLHGARAQEEYLARSTALWACLRDNAMYPYHQAQQDPFYSDYVLYSPAVPVLRDDAGALLETPYPCSIITSPAVHAIGVADHLPDRLDAIGPVMWKRILKVLAVAQQHEHRALVLGAWGCGAFRNDGNVIAALFRQALEEDFAGAFEHVVFAIADWSAEETFIGPFKRVFGDGAMPLTTAV